LAIVHPVIVCRAALAQPIADEDAVILRSFQTFNCLLNSSPKEQHLVTRDYSQLQCKTFCPAISVDALFYVFQFART
jgi:hypothetical protein